MSFEPGVILVQISQSRHFCFWFGICAFPHNQFVVVYDHSFLFELYYWSDESGKKCHHHAEQVYKEKFWGYIDAISWNYLKFKPIILCHCLGCNCVQSINVKANIQQIFKCKWRHYAITHYIHKYFFKLKIFSSKITFKIDWDWILCGETEVKKNYYVASNAAWARSRNTEQLTPIFSDSMNQLIKCRKERFIRR